MNDDTIIETLDDLQQTLEAERSALLDGRFEDLSDTATRKEQLLDALSSGDLNDMQDELQNLRQKLAENERLLSAAQMGFSQANKRLTDIREAIGQLKTYNGAGQVKSNPTIDPSVSIKA